MCQTADVDEGRRAEEAVRAEAVAPAAAAAADVGMDAAPDEDRDGEDQEPELGVEEAKAELPEDLANPGAEDAAATESK